MNRWAFHSSKKVASQYIESVKSVTFIWTRQLFRPFSDLLPQPSRSVEETSRPSMVKSRSPSARSWMGARLPLGIRLPSSTPFSGRSASITLVFLTATAAVGGTGTEAGAGAAAVGAAG